MGGLGSGRRPVYSDDVCWEGLRLFNAGVPWPEASRRLGVPADVLRDRAYKRGWHRAHRLRRPRGMSLNLPPAETDLAYLAAMVDGEGHISRRAPERGRRVAYSVGISNTSTELMEWLQTIGGSLCDPGGRGVYRWQVAAARDVVALLSAIEPYMRIKRAKALVAVDELRAYLGLELTREQVEARMDELLALEMVA